MKMTPKMTIDALRLLKKHPEVFDPADDDETKQSLQGVAAMYLAVKAEGKTDLDFSTWYESADVSSITDDDEEDEAEADPTE